MCRISITQTIHHSISSEVFYSRLGILDLGSYYQSRVHRWSGHVAHMSMNWAPRQLLTGWVAYPRPIWCPDTNFDRTQKKALKRSDLRTEFAMCSASAHDRPRWRLLTHFTPTPSPPALNQPPANPNAPLPGHGSISPAFAVPT